MGVVLQTGGFLNEDFNYGYPYLQKVPYSPYEFEYSNHNHAYEGDFHPKSYLRKQFSLHYANRKDEPNNYDKGVHGGAQTVNFYYLLFPLLQWNDVQTLTMVVHLSAAATLSYDRSFDGYKTDRFYLVINQHVMHMHSNSAGHGWTTDTVGMRGGWNTISWVLKTGSYVPPTTRGGVTVKNAKPPVLPRYLRLTNININKNVSSIPVGRFPWLPFNSDSTVVARGTINSLPKVSMKCTSYMGAGRIAGRIDLIGTSSFITDSQTESDLGAATFAGDSTLTAVGSNDQFHQSLDAGFGVNTYGDLSIETPIDIPQTVLNLIKPMVSTTVTMPNPIIVQGKAYVPAYVGVQNSVATSAHTYAYTDAPSPTSINHVLPVAATYRWVATDVGGADDAAVTSWPEHSGSGPAFQSSGIYSPTVHPHTFFHNESLSLQTYGRVVHMWWRFVQHMWVDIGTANATSNYTWSVCGLIHPMSNNQWQYVLDFGNPTPTTFDDQVNAGDAVQITDGITDDGLLGLGVHDRTTYVNPHAQPGTQLLYAMNIPTTRPICLTFVRVGNAINVYIYGYKLAERKTLYGTTANNRHWVLGRKKNWISEYAASHMSLFEIGYWNRALALTEVETLSNYLMGVYLFNLYK